MPYNSSGRFMIKGWKMISGYNCRWATVQLSLSEASLAAWRSKAISDFSGFSSCANQSLADARALVFGSFWSNWLHLAQRIESALRSQVGSLWSETVFFFFFFLSFFLSFSFFFYSVEIKQFWKAIVYPLAVEAHKYSTWFIKKRALLSGAARSSSFPF